MCRGHRTILLLLPLGALLVLAGLLLRRVGASHEDGPTPELGSHGSSAADPFAQPSRELDGETPVPDAEDGVLLGGHGPPTRALEITRARPWHPSPGPPPPPSHDVVAFLVGTVVDSEGRPVEGAQVHLPRSGVEDHTNETGGYRLRVHWKGAQTIHGSAHGFGTGELTELTVDRDGEFEAPPLILRGTGWCSGVVVFPDGSPATDVAVEATVRADRRGSRAAARLPGLTSCVLLTDANGRFRLAGLRPGAYILSAPRLSHHDVFAPAGHTHEDIRLVLAGRRVRVTVVDEAGRPLQGVDVRATRCWGKQAGSGFGRPKRPDDVLVLWGHPGERDVLLLTLRGYLPHEHCIEFDDATWSRDETVVLTRERRVRGTVGLALQREGGPWIRELTASLYSASGTYRVPGFRHVRAGPGDVVSLPPGRWTLEIAPTAAWEDDDYSGYDFPACGQVEVVAGERRNLSLASRLGGRVRVIGTRGAGVDPDADLTVNVGLVVPSEVADDPDRDYVDLDGFDDEPILSPIVAPGPWLVEVEGDDVEDQLLPIVVRAGRTLDVHVTLVPDSGDVDAEDEE